MQSELINDETLMKGVKAGDLDQLVPLFDRYQKPLFNFFLGLSSDRDTSDDLVQNLFVRIMKYRHTYRDGHSFKTWIYQMARNLFYDHYRSENRKQQMMERVIQETTSINADDAGEIEVQEERLRQALVSLPEDKREVLVLSRFQNLKYEEIASITGTTEANVKVKVHRAIQQLRTKYFQVENHGM